MCLAYTRHNFRQMAQAFSPKSVLSHRPEICHCTSQIKPTAIPQEYNETPNHPIQSAQNMWHLLCSGRAPTYQHTNSRPYSTTLATLSLIQHWPKQPRVISFIGTVYAGPHAILVPPPKCMGSSTPCLCYLGCAAAFAPQTPLGFGTVYTGIRWGEVRQSRGLTYPS